MANFGAKMKNIFGHGKKGMPVDATTKVSPVNVHQQGQQADIPQQSTHASSSRESAAMSAKQADKHSEELARRVAEEREAKGKIPVYPGLDPRYKIIQKMGDGAFSNVYRAKDLNGGQDVAIKVVRKFEMTASQDRRDGALHPDLAKKQPKAADRGNILKEVKIMQTLDHPNVIKLVNFHESSQYYFIILELAPGGELFHQIVRLTYFSEELSRHVIKQVADALLYLHEIAGVVHRDIKPENLLFYPTPFVPAKSPKPKAEGDEDKEDEGEFIPGVGAGEIGVVKLADFGLSKVVWDTQTQTPCGTVGYTAPEIVKDERYSKSVDMWAVGCVLYTLLCGFPPFYDESISVLTDKVANGQYTFLSPWWDGISKPAQDLVSHLLTVDPNKRYTVQQFLDHPWITQEKDKPTYAALDAPPLATPAAERSMDPLRAFQPERFESPGAGRRMDFRSPGAVNLREVFDVGIAIQRDGDEAKRRNQNAQGHRGMIDSVVDEEDEDADGRDENGQVPNKAARQSDMAAVQESLKKTSLNNAGQGQRAPQKGYGQHSAAVAASARKIKQPVGPFELRLDGATLLGRRNKGPSNLRESTLQE